MTRLRVMTLNVMRGGRRGPALHELVRAVRPDVLLVNESPKTPLLWRKRCRSLCDGWQMRYLGGGRGAGSNLIAVSDRVGVKHAEVTRIPQPLFQPPRGIVSAQLRVEGRLVGAVGCHLSLAPQRRLAEVERVLEVADRLRGTVVVGGDLNEPPDGASWRRLRARGYLDHGTEEWPTYPAHDPDLRIDALLFRGDARVRHHGDPGVPLELQRAASDHLGVLAVLEI